MSRELIAVGEGGPLVRLAVAMRRLRALGYEAHIAFSNGPQRCLLVDDGLSPHDVAQIDAYVIYNNPINIKKNEK
jgi:hypothetical protein